MLRASTILCCALSIGNIPAVRSQQLPQREAFVQEVHNRIQKYLNQSLDLDNPRHKAGVIFRLTRTSLLCGGSMVPVMFGEFNISGVRPIDVVNVIADYQSGTAWCSSCKSFKLLGEWPKQRLRGILGLFGAWPAQDRQAYNWQMVDMDGCSKSYMFVTTSQFSDVLQQRQPLNPDAVKFDNCLTGYSVRTIQAGVHVVFSQHVNPHPFLVSERQVLNVAWGKIVHHVTELRHRALWQRKRAWADNQTNMPLWLFPSGPCNSLEHVHSNFSQAAYTRLPSHGFFGSNLNTILLWVGFILLFAFLITLLSFCCMVWCKRRNSEALDTLTSEDSETEMIEKEAGPNGHKALLLIACCKRKSNQGRPLFSN